MAPKVPYSIDPLLDFEDSPKLVDGRLNFVLYSSNFINLRVPYSMSLSDGWMKHLIESNFYLQYTVKLDKGDYVIRLQVRHDKKDLLEKLNEQPILLNQKLNSNISLDVYNTYSQALIGGKKAGVTHVGNASTLSQFYIAPLSPDKFNTKTNNTAHYLTGYLTCAKDENGKRVDTYPFKYVLHDTSVVKKNNNNNNTNGEKTKLDEYNEALRDLKVQWISKLGKRINKVKLT